MDTRERRWLAIAIALLVGATLGAGCKGKSSSPIGASPTATQVGIASQGIAIDGQYTMNVGDQIQVSAMVTMSDGAREDRTATAAWSTDNAAIATVNAGLITAVAVGQAVITARYDSVLARLSVTVRGSGSGTGGPGGGPGDPGNPGGPGRSVRIDVDGPATLAVGRSEPLTAVLHFEDGSWDHVGHMATWTVTPTSVASISDGKLWGIAPGTATVSAHHDGHTDSIRTEITANPVTVNRVDIAGPSSVAVGSTVQLTATATLSDGSQHPATSAAQWQSSNASVATVVNGQVRGVAAGSAVITATVQGVSAQATVQVTGGANPGNPTVTSLSITGTTALTVGGTTQLTATATLSNGTQQNVTAGATWSSGNGAVASVASGLVSGVAAGSAAIAASYQGVSQQVSVTVTASGGPTPTLTSLSIDGAGAVVVGQSRQLTAVAHFSNGSQQVVTSATAWNSSAPATATVSGGLVTGVAAGSATIGVSYQGQSASVSISVTAAPISVVGLTVTGNLSLPVGGQTQLTVRASMSNGTIVDVTGQASYQSSNPLLVSVSASGQVSALLAGVANITCTYQGVSATVQLQVTVAVPTVTGVTINGASTVSLLQLINLTAMATLSDGTTQNVTNSCTWSSSNLGILDLVGNGVLRGLLLGNVTVTVNYQGKSAQKTITVTL